MRERGESSKMAEERKLIKLGNSSFAVALPKEWISKSGLKKGDKVFIMPNNNGELMISSEFKKANMEKKTSINLEGKNEDEIARELISAYIGGYNTIRVSGSEEKMRIIKTKSKKFLNLELIENNGKEGVFRDLLDIENLDIANFMKRMDNNIKEMFSILSNISENKKTNSNALKELEEIDNDVNKFYFLVWRLMNLGIDNPSIQSHLKINPKALVTFFWIAYNLEHIGDELKKTAKKISQTTEKSPHLTNTINLTKNLYDSSIKSFFDRNKELSKEVILKKEEITKMCEKLSNLKDFAGIGEKLHQINLNIHNNSKMVFYDL